jgi:transposase
MGEVSTIGVDIAKSVFQIHAVDADGAVVIRKRVGRAKVLEFFADLPPCLVGMEACATAHHWARELKKFGHDARLMPPTYVKAYVKRGKVGLHSATYFINVTRFLTSDANDRVVYWGRVEAH